jgi:hypothetical protein
MVIGPRVVHAGAGPLEAVSAEMLPPPDVPTMVTVAKVELAAARSPASATSVDITRDVMFLIIFLVLPK